MRGFKTAVSVGVVAILIGSAACGGSAASSSSTTAPSAVTYTDVFSGTVSQGGTSYGTDNQNHFTVHQAGNLSATITKLSPLSTITIGLGLGVYDAPTATCTLQLFADTAKLNLQLTASVSLSGELCVGVYDVGNVTDPVDYEVSITHT
jgi:hypothetical protein